MIGREPVARQILRIDGDDLLSRSHASIHYRRGNLTVADNDSRNGTRRNGVQIERAPLEDGDFLRIGDTFLVVRWAKPLADYPIDELSGVAASIAELRHTIHLVAKAKATVVLLGESGTGKGQSAKALHRMSGRPGNFVAVNCAAIPEALAESMLFGHKAGAFTGAAKDEPGWFRAAHRGTLFIDEIGDMPATLQPKLLHAIEDGHITPVGSTRPEPVDVRLVAATSVDLHEAVAQKKFRGDLYARLAEIVVGVPPLRERREDVLGMLAQFLGPDAAPIAPDLAARLLVYPWPFNVRELKNVATELAIRGVGRAELTDDLIAWRLDEPVEPAPAPADAAVDLNRERVEDALKRGGGVVSAVARDLGCSRRHLYRLMERHGLEASEYR